LLPNFTALNHVKSLLKYIFKDSIGGYMKPSSKTHTTFKPITSIGLSRQFRRENGFGDRFLQRLIIKLDYEVIDQNNIVN